MIDPMVVAICAFVAMWALTTSKTEIDARIIAIPFAVQTVIYLAFSAFELDVEVRQFAARLNNVLIAIAYIVVVVVMRYRNGK